MAEEYKVGYKQPPKNSTWRKGNSGNPRGRKKDVRNLKTDLTEELGETLSITEQGSSRKITKQRGLIKALIAKAVKGDSRAANILINMIFRLLHPDLAETPPTDLLQEDRDILEAFIEQHQAKKKARDKT
jgi:hypothetical protein